jgi:hypothetical protein
LVQTYNAQGYGPWNSQGFTLTPRPESPNGWSEPLATADRFRLVMGGATGLDRETGLVWEQNPSSTTFIWQSALDGTRCVLPNIAV